MRRLPGSIGRRCWPISAAGQFSTFKQALSDLAVARLSPIAGEMRRLTADPAEIDRILADGSARARAIARPVYT